MLLPLDCRVTRSNVKDVVRFKGKRTNLGFASRIPRNDKKEYENIIPVIQTEGLDIMQNQRTINSGEKTLKNQGHGKCRKKSDQRTIKPALLPESKTQPKLALHL